jgi:uncharacterized protein YjbI with pentapeptide repeats
MKRIREFVGRRKCWVFVVVMLLMILGWGAHAHFVQGRTWINWAGFETKTLWGLMELLIVPMAVVWGAWWLDRRQKKTEREFEDKRLEKDREIAREKRQDATLEAYFDRMTALLLEEELRNSEVDDEVRKIARTRTLAVLRRLDGKRKAEVVQFLHEADLIQVDSPVVDLRGADLSRVDLTGADLSGADLSGTDLSRAILLMADLSGADLSETILWRTKLSQTNLRGSDLRGGHYLGEAYFWGTKWGGAKVWARDVEALKSTGADVDGVEVVEESDEG